MSSIGGGDVLMFRDVLNFVLMRSFALIAEGWRAATPLRESLDPPKGHLLELTRQKDIYLRTRRFYTKKRERVDVVLSSYVCE